MTGLAYAREVRAELARFALKTEDAVRAEFLGLTLATAPGSEGVALASPVAARRALRLVRHLGLPYQVRVVRRGRGLGYRIVGVAPLTLSAPVRHVIVEHPGPFLRGAFLAHGYMNDPERGFHLEYRVPGAEEAAYLAALLARLRVKAGTVPHRRGYTVYVKGQEALVRLLAAMGAHQAVLEVESLRVMRAMKNQVNRLVNSETANLARTVASGIEQARILDAARLGPEWQRLPRPLRELGRLRIEHPDWSLRELGRALSPPLSKSAVNHRMRRLLTLIGGGTPRP